jgi:hypothetical protein
VKLLPTAISHGYSTDIACDSSTKKHHMKGVMYYHKMIRLITLRCNKASGKYTTGRYHGRFHIISEGLASTDKVGP